MIAAPRVPLPSDALLSQRPGLTGTKARASALVDALLLHHKVDLQHGLGAGGTSRFWILWSRLVDRRASRQLGSLAPKR
eukprot:5499897-Alexandrium_andersonii.AAC.1